MPAFAGEPLGVEAEPIVVVLAVLLYGVGDFIMMGSRKHTSEEMTEISSSSFPFSSTAMPRLLLLNA